MGGRGAKSSLTTEQIRQKNQEYMAQMREQGRETLRQSIQQDLENIKPKTNSKEIKAVYDSIQGKQDRYLTIGANTKNFDRIIDNAVTIRHYDQDEMEVRNTTARTPSEVRQMQADIRRDLSRFGRGGRNGMRMYYSKDGDEFVLSYYSGYTYRIKLR